MAHFDPTDMAMMSKSKGGGFSANVPMVTGQAQTSPGPSASFKDEDGKLCAQAFTVRFGVLAPNIDSTLGEGEYANFDAVAIIKYTVEGVSIQRMITIAQGVAISGIADSVDVQFLDITPVSQDNIGINYQVFVQVAPGLRASYTLPPTLEAFTDIVNGAAVIKSGIVTVVAGGTARYPVPQRAGVISVEVVVSDQPVFVTMGSPNGDYKKYQVLPGANYGFIVLATNSAYVTITGNGAAEASSNVTVTWGIEG